jgi:8-oxo-dGTP pyrophosphatase MutT (NUDIX family)
VALLPSTAAARLGEVLDALPEPAWARSGIRRSGERFTVAGLGRFALHESHHHLADAGRGLAAVTGDDPRVAEVEGLLAARRLAGPVDEREGGAIGAFAAELGRLGRPFDEQADPTHVTSSAIVLAADGSGVLLHRHKRLGLWLQPGGHVDAGEGLAAAAVREAVEETGLGLAHPAPGPWLVHVDVHPGGRGHRHLDLRWLLVGDGEPAPAPGESPDVRWFGWEEAVGLADPGLAGALAALRPQRA